MKLKVDYLILKYNALLVFMFLSLSAMTQNYGVERSSQQKTFGDRLDIFYDIPDNWHPDIQPWSRFDLVSRAIAIDTSELEITSNRNTDLQFTFIDNNDCLGIPPEEINKAKQTIDDSTEIVSRYRSYEKPLFKHFYHSEANLFEVNVKDFSLRVNPMLNVDLMPATKDDELLFNNKRGIDIRAIIDDKIYFNTRIVESQSRFPDYVRYFIDRNDGLPGAGFYKSHDSRIFGVDGGHDYLTTTAYVGLQVSRHVAIELGHGSHFLGNGVRSLLLSDFGDDYFYLKFNTRIWKFQYQNIFAELNPISSKRSENDVLLPKKYSATHYLSLNIGKNARIGLFESVVFARQNDFEFQYLNPVILYRTVEYGLGSADNVILGLNASCNLRNTLQIYGQFILDDFNFKRISDGNDWWGNKFGYQIGLKYLDIFKVHKLDLTLEFNRVRPYTFTHRDSISNYAHSSLALAHPLGANFREIIAELRYRHNEKWQFESRIAYMQYGEDIGEDNYGKDILKPNISRIGNTGVTLLQGDQVSTTLWYFTASYQFFHNMFLEGIVSGRIASSESGGHDLESFYAGIGIRINMKRKEFLF